MKDSSRLIAIAVSTLIVLLAVVVWKFRPLESKPLLPRKPQPASLDQWSVVKKGDGNSLRQVIWTGQQFLAVGYGIILTSPDGVHWSSIPIDPTESLWGVGTNGKTAVAVGERGLIMTSTDLAKWTVRQSGTPIRLMSVFWANGQFLALGDNGVALISADGLTWVPHQSSNITFHHGIWTGSQYVVAAYESVVTSSDGTRWANPIRAGRMLTTAGHGSTFIAVGNAPRNLLLTKDGTNWSEASPVATDLSGATWDGFQFIVVGTKDTIISSPDGVTWTPHASKTGLNLADVAEHDGAVVAVSTTGSIILNKKIAQAALP